MTWLLRMHGMLASLNALLLLLLLRLVLLQCEGQKVCLAWEEVPSAALSQQQVRLRGTFL